MKTSNAARLIFGVTAILAVGFLVQAESGQKRLNTPNTKSAPLRIVDQQGRPAVNGVPAPTGQIVDVTVGPGGTLTFDPSTVNISVGDTVRWTWAASGHSVTSGDPCTANGQFCSPNNTNCGQCVTSIQGFVYEFTFTQAGSFSYFCCSHCAFGMTGMVNVSEGGCSWGAGAPLPTPGARQVGVYFPANGKFYSMGGRNSDNQGSEFTHPFEYDPGSNMWTTKAATYPDGIVNNMACGVLNESGTDYIYCVGGSQVVTNLVTGRVFRYNPISDVITTVAGGDWPPGANTLPGGFSIFNNKLYVLGGFANPPTGDSTDQIWEYTPATNAWVQKAAHLPVPLCYIPAATIGDLIYTGGGASIVAGVLTPTTNSYQYNPVADSIIMIANIPRPTDNTRGFNFCNQLWVPGGDDTTFPNPTTEVDIYDPMSNTWSLGQPMITGRRNFATDTDGTNRVWAAGGYDTTGVPTDAMEVFNCPVSPCAPSPTPTATATATATATPTATPTSTPGGTRPTPTPRPRPTPAPRP